jgi:DNA polymerase
MSPPFKRVLTVDWESTWCRKSGFTLTKMSTEEYVRDPRFKPWGLCYHEVGDPTGPIWVRGKDVRDWAHSIDWTTTAMNSHNAIFDVSVLAWHYGVHPCFVIDTLSMARALRGKHAGNSLAKLAADYGWPAKGNAVHSTDGILDELPFEIEVELADYCKHDVRLGEMALEQFLPGYPTKELRLIDMTIRMFTKPVFVLDQNMMVDAIDEEKERREGLLKRLGVEESTLASNDQFAEVLRKLGVEPPTKKKNPTKKTPNPVGRNFAFAKTDALFQQMLNGDNEDVALACEARLVVKSTQARTRAQRFADIAGRGLLPVPLNYYAAHPGRWGGSEGINLQNLKRGSVLRKAIMAPKGYVVCVIDLAQIEARVLAWVAGYLALLTLFRSGVDVYAAFGAQMFSIPGMTKDTHPLLRQSAKSAVLGAGYGLGWSSFAAQLLVGFLGAPPVRYDMAAAKLLGVTKYDVDRFVNWEVNLQRMAEIPHTCTESELLIHSLASKAIIDKYRAAAPEVKALWELCQNQLVESLVGGQDFDFKCLRFTKGAIELPNGMALRYRNLRMERDEKGKDSWFYGERERARLYGPKMVENFTQALARIVMADGMLRIDKRFPVRLTVHDEVVFLAPEQEAKEALAWGKAQMIVEPKYMPGLPLDASVGSHQRYGMAKD